MKKGFYLLLVIVMVLTASVLPLSADEGFYGEYERLIDSAGLLSENEADDILARLNELCESENFDIAILTTQNLGEYQSASEYADDAFDYFDYGYGDSRDGILLLISIDTRDCYLSTHGYGITAFTDYGIEYLLNQLKPELQSGDYYAVFTKFIDYARDYIEKARDGHPYDISSLPREPLSILWIPGSMVIGFVIASIYVGGLKRKLKTVNPALAAASYVRKDSLKVTSSRDLYLYRNISRTQKSKAPEGGSSTHTSSGETHGGGGTKF